MARAGVRGGIGQVAGPRSCKSFWVMVRVLDFFFFFFKYSESVLWKSSLR